MSLRNFTINGIRYTAGGRVDGIWVDGPTIPLTITCSIQPVSGEEKQNTPTIQRAKGPIYRVYTDSNLFTTRENQKPDELTIFGKKFEVVEKQSWQNNIINHYKYYVVEVLDK